MSKLIHPIGCKVNHRNRGPAESLKFTQFNIDAKLNMELLFSAFNEIEEGLIDLRGCLDTTKIYAPYVDIVKLNDQVKKGMELSIIG